MDLLKLKKIIQKNNQPEFRLVQIRKAVFQDGAASFAEISTLSKELRKLLDKETKILSFEAEKILVASDGRSAKAILKCADGNLAETVLISPKPGHWSVCVSCQIGCPMSCDFCATGKNGFQRNLIAEEITDQVLFWKQYLKKYKFKNSDIQKNLKSENKKTGNRGISSVVYMGMGEPFANWENVKESLKILTDKNFFGFGSRSISISTSGIPEGIEKIAEEFPQINLALSLHFASDEKRSRFMPVNRKYDLKKMCRALQNYFRKNNRKVFVEYILLEDINDSEEDARELVEYLRSISKIHLLHVNLIRYNAIGAGLTASSLDKTRKFREFLIKNGVSTTIRKSLGEEIQGACGQLAGKI